MPGTREIYDATTVHEIEIILDDVSGSDPPTAPPVGGDGGGDRNRRGGHPEQPMARRYQTAVIVGMVSILIFFMALSSAFLVRKMANDWIPTRLPSVIWLNTLLLFASSATLEFSRRRLAVGDSHGFQRLWTTTTALGSLFLVGQLVAWRQLVAQGVYVATNPASSFFYIITAAHGVHVVGGMCALFYVLVRNFQKAKISRAAAAEITSYYWHFMDGLWIFLLALLWLGN
jgi:cytochrome c oxidase subunit III